jgi:hypothetical protein
MKKAKGVMVSMISTAVMLLMSSCSGSQLKKADLQGTWIPDKPSQKWIKVAGDRSRCQIVLRADGTFNAAVPDYFMQTADKSVGRLMVGKGQWFLVTAGGQTKLTIEFSEVDGERITWNVEGLHVETKNRLMFWVGDPDSGDRFVFVRAPGQNEESHKKGP